jgi:hypothetical protein
VGHYGTLDRFWGVLPSKIQVTVAVEGWIATKSMWRFLLLPGNIGGVPGFFRGLALFCFSVDFGERLGLQESR